MNYSYSKLWTYLTCPRMYKKRYLDHEKFYLSYLMKLGIKIHNIITVATNNYKRRGKVNIREIIDNHFLVSPDFEMYSDCCDILANFDMNLFPIENLYKTESSGKFMVDRNIINFRTDRLDSWDTKGINIIEYKTGNVYEELSLQDKIYCLGVKYLFPSCDKIKVNKYFIKYNKVIEHAVNFKDFDDWKDDIREIIKKIEMDDQFLPKKSYKCEYCCYDCEEIT